MVLIPGGTTNYTKCITFSICNISSTCVGNIVIVKRKDYDFFEESLVSILIKKSRKPTEVRRGERQNTQSPSPQLLLGRRAIDLPASNAYSGLGQSTRCSGA